MTNAEYAIGLRAAADFYEQNPSIPVPSSDLSNFATNGKEMARIVVKALGHCDKLYSESGLLTVSAVRSGLTLRFVFHREDVCEKVVVGTKTIAAHVRPAREEEHVPECVIEETEWRCGSLLAESEAA